MSAKTATISAQQIVVASFLIKKKDTVQILRPVTITTVLFKDMQAVQEMIVSKQIIVDHHQKKVSERELTADHSLVRLKNLPIG